MIALLTEEDLDLVGLVTEVVVRNEGRPWRAALEELDDLHRATERAYSKRFQALIGAVQRVTGGRLRNTRIARRARGLVLGHPAFEPHDRQARIDHAALMLDVPPAAVETLLWCDLPRERPIELLQGPPDVHEVAAFANVALLQRAVMRAQALHLRLGASDAGAVARAAAARGLMTSARLLDGRSVQGDEQVVLDIAGPLSLFHGTSVYGRALADLVPLLASVRDWTLDIEVVLPLTSYTTHVESPALLPRAPARLSTPRQAVVKLCRALERRALPFAIRPAPDLVRAGDQLVWPDLLIESALGRTYVDLLPFWTEAYVCARLAAYGAAGARAILCVDAGRSGERTTTLPAEVLVFRKHLDPELLVERVQAQEPLRSTSNGPKNASSGMSMSPTPSSSPSPPR